jgi:hypothetical protein
MGARRSITPHFEIDNFAMATSLIASTRGLALLPASLSGIDDLIARTSIKARLTSNPGRPDGRNDEMPVPRSGG